MTLMTLPAASRYGAIKAIMDLARANGLSGMGGECGEVAIAMKRVLFGNKAFLLGGLNSEFERHNVLIGHIVVSVDDEDSNCLHFDEKGIPLSCEEVKAWGSVDHTDPDWIARARDLGFELTEEAATTTAMLEFDDEADILINMPGSGLDEKMQLLRKAMETLGYSPCDQPVIKNRRISLP